jgi:membrane protein
MTHPIWQIEKCAHHKDSCMAVVHSTIGQPLDDHFKPAKAYVSRWPLCSLWDLQGTPVRVLATRTWRSIIADRLFGHAAELGFYFLFALFPTLFSASSILGLAARSASRIYDRLLDYMALVIPTSALGAILSTFNETTAASTPGKVTFGVLASLWSASVGISAIQDTLNDVYKIKSARSYIYARICAIGLTILLTVLLTLMLGALFGGDLVARISARHVPNWLLAGALGIAARIAGWTVATALLTLSFAVIYNLAPAFKRRCFHWLTPGGAVGIAGWLVTSLGFRAYLHFFNSYTIYYGSLGAVIVLLVWFYATGLMLLLGAEINSEIEAAAAERQVASVQAAWQIGQVPNRGDIGKPG